MFLTRKSNNCVGTASVQVDSADGSKLIEQTLPSLISLRFPVLEGQQTTKILRSFVQALQSDCIPLETFQEEE